MEKNIMLVRRAAEIQPKGLKKGFVLGKGMKVLDKSLLFYHQNK
jgi:hypothetical protein